MGAIMETPFDLAYLLGTAILGVFILRMARGRRDVRLFGLLTLVLVGGDAFHLVPRVLGHLSSEGLAGYTAALGIGKLVTSVTMTVFYVLLYHFWQLYRGLCANRALTCTVWALALVRIALCCFPQNAWTQATTPASWYWGIYRNIPFVLLGVVMVWYLWQTGRSDRFFRWAALAVTLSFGFYLPVVLWADKSAMVGMLMLPKTCCYVWLVAMGYRRAKAE